MSKFIGRRVNLGIGKEETRGLGVDATLTVPKVNITVDDKANKARSGEGLGSISGNGSQAIVTGRFSEGNLEAEINADSFGLIMLALMGAESVTTVLDAKKHTYTLSESNQHQSLSLHVDDPIGDTQFKMSMIDTLEIDVSPDEIAKFSIGFKCKKGNDGTFTPSYAADYKFVGRELVFKVAADTASLAAATAISVKSLKLTINKNTDYDWVCGTLEPEDILNKQFTAQIAITLNYEDRTWRDYMTGASIKACSIQLKNMRQTIGTNNPTVYFEFPTVDFSEWESQRGNDEVAGQTINLTALWDIATSKLFSDCYVINNKDAY